MVACGVRSVSNSHICFIRYQQHSAAHPAAANHNDVTIHSVSMSHLSQLVNLHQQHVLLGFQLGRMP